MIGIFQKTNVCWNVYPNRQSNGRVSAISFEYLYWLITLTSSFSCWSLSDRGKSYDHPCGTTTPKCIIDNRQSVVVFVFVLSIIC